MCFKILSAFVGLPSAKSMEEDSIILPIGIVPTEACESHFLINEHERHFCVTVILVPLLHSIVLSHSARQMGKTGIGREAMTLTRGTTFVYGVVHFGEILCVDNY